MMERLQSSKMIAIRSKTNRKQLKVFIIPINSTAIETHVNENNKHVLTWKDENEITSSRIINLQVPLSTTFDIWTIIEHFELFIMGDLSFYVTAMCQDGYSHCKCCYCDLTSIE